MLPNNEINKKVMHLSTTAVQKPEKPEVRRFQASNNPKVESPQAKIFEDFEN